MSQGAAEGGLGRSRAPCAPPQAIRAADGVGFITPDPAAAPAATTPILAATGAQLQPLLHGCECRRGVRGSPPSAKPPSRPTTPSRPEKLSTRSGPSGS